MVSPMMIPALEHLMRKLEIESKRPFAATIICSWALGANHVIAGLSMAFLRAHPKSAIARMTTDGFAICEKLDDLIALATTEGTPLG